MSALPHEAPVPRAAAVQLHRAVRRARMALTCILPLVALAILVPVQWRRTDTARDVSAYVLAAKKARAGESIYKPYPPPVPHDPGKLGPVYLYPPFLAAGLSLLPPMRYQTFANIWLTFLLICIAAYAAVLSRLATGRVRPVATMGAATLLLYYPGTVVALNFGQVDPLVWLLGGLAVASTSASTRGLGLAGAAMLKVSPVWALVPAAARQGRRVLLGAGAAGGLGLLVALVALGPAGFVTSCYEWVRYVVPHVGQGQMHTLSVDGLPGWIPFNNVSIAYAPLLIAHAAGWEPVGTLPLAIRVYLMVVGIAAPLVAAWLSRRRSPGLQCALVLAAAMMFAPIARATYLPGLYALVAIWLGERRATREAQARSARGADARNAPRNAEALA